MHSLRELPGCLQIQTRCSDGVASSSSRLSSIWRRLLGAMFCCGSRPNPFFCFAFLAIAATNGPSACLPLFGGSRLFANIFGAKAHLADDAGAPASGTDL